MEPVIKTTPGRLDVRDVCVVVLMTVAACLGGRNVCSVWLMMLSAQLAPLGV